MNSRSENRLSSSFRLVMLREDTSQWHRKSTTFDRNDVFFSRKFSAKIQV